jgi:hypothetical protein
MKQNKLPWQKTCSTHPWSFKICSKCGFEWPDRSAFLSDPTVQIVGYQVHFEHLTAGLFLFNHDCKTTLAIKAGEFEDLYNGPIFIEKLSGTESCQGHCLQRDNLHPCPSKCECAYVRSIIQKILHWPKKINY